MRHDSPGRLTFKLGYPPDLLHPNPFRFRGFLKLGVPDLGELSFVAVRLQLRLFGTAAINCDLPRFLPRLLLTRAAEVLWLRCYCKSCCGSRRFLPYYLFTLISSTVKTPSLASGPEHDMISQEFSVTRAAEVLWLRCYCKSCCGSRRFLPYYLFTLISSTVKTPSLASGPERDMISQEFSVRKKKLKQDSTTSTAEQSQRTNTDDRSNGPQDLLLRHTGQG
jgi:hypothetical protein